MRFAAVVVTYNRKELLIKTLEALKNQEEKLNTIYIIDNCSTDMTYEFLVENNFIPKKHFDRTKKYIIKYDNVCYIWLPENTGGAGGFYEGIKIAHEEKNDWIWVMDDDVYPDKFALLEYKKFILNNKSEIGALMGARYYNDKPFSFEATVHDFSNLFSINFNKNFVNENLLLKQDPILIRDIPFEGPMINSKVIDIIGYPNKEMFIIGDDTDYSIRINQYAPIFLLPSAKIKKMLNPNGKGKYKFTWKEYYYSRNIAYLNKTYGENFLVRYFRNVLRLGYEILRCLKHCMKNKDKSVLFYISKILEAYNDGMKSKLGRKYVPGDF